MNNLIANRKLTGLSAVVLALAVGAAIPSSQALAQTAKVRANIPFDFQNGSEHLLAGRYTINMESTHLMRLQNGKVTSSSLTRPEIDNQPAPRGKLVFRKYGSRYFLREVWLANKTEHLVLAKSKAEKRQQQIAMDVAEVNGTEVALLEPLR